VNGYDETRDVIAKFVAEKKLTHSILMMGGKPARELYYVSAFPTSYFLDRDGRILERTLGFEASEVNQLERHIQELLARPAPEQR
jgi:hypothetical protein